jgi:hypothetical protein
VTHCMRRSAMTSEPRWSSCLLLGWYEHDKELPASSAASSVISVLDSSFDVQPDGVDATQWPRFAISLRCDQDRRFLMENKVVQVVIVKKKNVS